VLPLVMAIGTVTALLGASLAMVQHDIKKILAYSTISQLGYMFIALGTGSEIAALFHLTTHAYFKSLLFLGAGTIIHATHTQDIREMGGLRKTMPWTTGVFVVGALALSGVFPFSGFWSKDDILMALWSSPHWYAHVSFAVALLVAGMTAFYMTRLCVRVFLGPEQAHAHEGHVGMIAPMAVLAAISTVIGFASPAFSRFLGETKGWPNLGMAAAGTLVALSGIGVGVWVFGMGKVDTEAAKKRFARTYRVLKAKFYFDALYERVFVGGYVALADRLSRFDASVIDGAVNGVATLWGATSQVAWTADIKIVDGAVNGLGRFVSKAGTRLRGLQAGEVQGYQRLAYGSLLILLVSSVLTPVIGAVPAFAGGAVLLLIMGVVALRGA